MREAVLATPDDAGLQASYERAAEAIRDDIRWLAEVCLPVIERVTGTPIGPSPSA